MNRRIVKLHYTIKAANAVGKNRKRCFSFFSLFSFSPLSLFSLFFYFLSTCIPSLISHTFSSFPHSFPPSSIHHSFPDSFSLFQARSLFFLLSASLFILHSYSSLVLSSFSPSLPRFFPSFLSFFPSLSFNFILYLTQAKKIHTHTRAETDLHMDDNCNIAVSFSCYKAWSPWDSETWTSAVALNPN